MWSLDGWWWLNSFNLLFIIFSPFQVRWWTYSIHWLFIFLYIKTRSVHISIFKAYGFQLCLFNRYLLLLWHTKESVSQRKCYKSWKFSFWFSFILWCFLLLISSCCSIWKRVFRNESAVIKWRHYILFLDVEIYFSVVFFVTFSFINIFF